MISRHQWKGDRPLSDNDSQAHAHTTPQAPDSTATRGQFLSLSSVGLGAAIGAVIGVPALGYALAPVTEEATWKPVLLGLVERFPADQTGAFKPFAAQYIENPKQPDISSGVAWVYNTGDTNPDWLARDAMFIVFSNRCMHVGCPVQSTLQGFACPCHGGQYNQQGQRVAGPPIRPLDRFQWEIREHNQLWITQRWSTDFIDGKLTYYPVKGPGQPVHLPFGPSFVENTLPDILYPPVTYTHGPVPRVH